MLRVGLTGGLASGKSTVGRLLSERGASVFDADEIVADLYRRGGAGAAAVRELFGDAVLDGAGGVDRARLAELVFQDPASRRALESKIHPLVRREIEQRFAGAERKGAAVAVAEASQILESGTEDSYDRVLLVIAPEAERVRRWSADGGDPGDAERRIRAQIAVEKAQTRASDVLVNDGTLAELAAKVDEVYRGWLALG